MSFAAQRLIGDRLTCRRSDRLLFENLSFSIEKKAGLVLTGPNGVGKTSLLRIVAGLLQPTGGSVGIEPGGDISIAEQCHFVGVRDGLKGSLTPREHVAFWIAMADMSERRRSTGDVDSILAEFGLAGFAQSPSAWLSTGQRRRLALARLLAIARPVWILDEPLNGLDAWAADELKRLVAWHMAAGGMVLAASHQPLDWPATAVLALGGNAASAAVRPESTP